MHTFSETGAGVPAFLAKLWRLVEDPETNNLICWSKDGRSFIIQNQAQFARELLPLNYKHNNMASFIRQLNMYGFHKITSIENGGLKFDRDEMEFTHPCFKRNCPYLLEHIKRKIASSKTGSVDDKANVKPEAVTKVLQDVKAMRGRQDSLDSRFSVMKQENEALWREIAALRQKHAKQQQIVNKLIQFLITIVQPQRNMSGVKRHMQLMINDTPENSSKMRKTSESDNDCGPVIHELGEELLDEVTTDVEQEMSAAHLPFTHAAATLSNPDADIASSPHTIERPHSSVSMMSSQHYDYSNQSMDDVCTFLNSPLNNSATSGSTDGIVQAVSPDGSKIVYHVTEVPDAADGQQAHDISAAGNNFNEDDVLTTPLVREEMARTQLLKQKNRQRRNISRNMSPMSAAGSASSTSSKSAKQSQQEQLQIPQPIQIKAESDTIDPMMFLNIYPDNQNLSKVSSAADAQLLSPNLSEDSSRQSNSNTTAASFLANSNTQGSVVTTGDNDLLVVGGGGGAGNSNSQDLYNPTNFIDSDMPADIFEDNSIMSAGDNSNFGTTDDYKLSQQQQYGRSTVNSGKFSTYLAGATAASPGVNQSNSNNGAATAAQPSTSAQAQAALTKNSNELVGGGKRSNENSNGFNGNNNNNMMLAKYNKSPTEDIMRLSTATEVHGHLENVQDELETLKDLLRSDVYSLDHSTLLGNPPKQFNALFENAKNRFILPPAMEEDILHKLFNDSEILGPYGLYLPNNDNSNNDKKGSELMAYQPVYDLSDIINDQGSLEDDNNLSNALQQIQYASQQQQQLQQQQQETAGSSSVLNTPYHD